MSRKNERREFPKDKYKYFKQGTTVFAVSTYAGRTVKGCAKLNPMDKFNEAFGKDLAAARCNQKVVNKRRKYNQELMEVLADYKYAIEKAYEQAVERYDNSVLECKRADEEVASLVQSL